MSIKEDTTRNGELSAPYKTCRIIRCELVGDQHDFVLEIATREGIIRLGIPAKQAIDLRNSIDAVTARFPEFGREVPQ